MSAVSKPAPTDFPSTIEPQSARSFALDHFGRAQLGHQRRNECLVRIAEKICRHPAGTLPQKLADTNDYKAMDLLMNREEVTHASVLAPHYLRTREKMAAVQGVVLILHDTTDLDFTGLSIPQLGPIGNGGGRGYLCHNSLAVDPANREVLGLVHQILHRRVAVGKKEGVKAKRERKSRESRLWSQAVEALETPPEVKVIDVADRGADIFEFLATEKRLGRHCLVRAQHNRSIRVGHDGAGERTRLYEHLRSLPAVGTKTRTVFDRNAKREREVKLSVSFAAVELQPPHVKKGIYEKKPLAVWCIRVFEENPPKGQKGLEWFLLTFEPVTTQEIAWEQCSWYECRYIVEEYHKSQKTGCDIERLQFETEQALQPMLAVLSVIAVMLLNLRLACRRPDAEQRQATEVVDRQHEELLRQWRYKDRREEMNIKEFYMALGRLGGHMNRRSDGNPGWLVLWRGWIKLQSMLTGANLERRRRANGPRRS